MWMMQYLSAQLEQPQRVNPSETRSRSRSRQRSSSAASNRLEERDENVVQRVASWQLQVDESTDWMKIEYNSQLA